MAKVTCPKCGSTDVARYVYGLVAPQSLRDDIARGRVRLGGCCIMPNSPAYRCNKCGNRFGNYATESVANK